MPPPLDAKINNILHKLEGEIVKKQMEKNASNKQKLVAKVKPKAPPIQAPKPHFTPKPQARVIRKNVARGR